MTTASQIATPPIIAVGFLCQRSVLGLAINPHLRAKTLTTGVKAAARAKDTKGGINLSGVTGIMNKSVERKLFDRSGKRQAAVSGEQLERRL
jgi:hypothetical protein